MTNDQKGALVRRGAAALMMALLMAVVANDAVSTTSSAGRDGANGTCSAVANDFSIRVCGNRLVDAKGLVVQLRGVNVSGLEGVPIQGWDPANPWGGNTGTPTPDWNTIKNWGVNTVRLPINEASWLGSMCVDYGGYGVVMDKGVKRPNQPGQIVRADPGGNYQITVKKSVSDATAAGLYVILDLHLSAPGDACPNAQNAMADADHAIEYWTSLASSFKSYPNVLFELFNEPFLDQAPLQEASAWAALLSGKGTIGSFNDQGTPGLIKRSWHPAGMQQMLNAVRATGATNVILTSTLAYSSAMDGWLKNHPADTLSPGQIGAVWHAYPAAGHPSQVSCMGLPSCSEKIMNSVREILTAGFPVVITEYGDKVGGNGAPFASVLLPFADVNGISYLAWTWDPWAGTEYYLITDGAGHPSAGYGTYVKAHYLCRSSGQVNCR